MLYREARSGICSGDLVLFRGTGLVPLGIRLATGSDYAHVGIAWVVAGRVMVIESRLKGGVQVHGLSTRLGDGAFWLPISAHQVFDLPRAIRDVDKPYSVLNCARAFFGLCALPRGFQCAQLAAAVLHLASDGWTPQRIREYFYSTTAISLVAGM